MRRKEVNMLSGPIAKALLTIAFPIMIMNVLTSLFNVIDMTILKSFGSDELAVGAVGTCGTLISLISGLVTGVSAGANGVVAKCIGKGDRERIDRSVGTAIALAIAGGFLLLVIGVSFAMVFLRLVNCPEELFSKATLYFRLYFAGTPILMVYTFCAALLRASGDSRRQMFFSILGGVVKVVGTFLFVAVFKMSVEGVAFATIISWTTSAVLAFRALLKNQGVVRIKPEKIRFYWKEMGEILFIGIPAGLQQALYSVANVIITATVNSFGAAATTGISIANNFDGILYQISVSPALAVMPYVSQNVGVGNIKRATKAVSRGMLITIGFGATFGALSAIFSGQLSSIMSSDPTVIAYSQQKMVIISSTYFICGINEIMGAALKGMGKPIVTTIATLIFMCALRFVWVYLIFPLCPNLTFLYLVWPIGWTLSITMLLFWYFPTVKKLSALCANTAAQN